MSPEKTPLQNMLISRPVRARLVRLCGRLTEGLADAEDLAQETLIEAWRHRESLRCPESLPSWLAGIAANVCRRWHRRQAIEAARSTTLDEVAGMSFVFDTEEMLRRREISALLDRGMGHLSPADRELLVARYREDSSLAEIASRAGCTVNTATVRLRRSRESLQRVLTIRLRQEAVDCGLIAHAAETWEQTRLWCFRCGRERLEGCFSARNASSMGSTGFAVRCPQCDGISGDVAFSTAHRAMDAARVLGPTRSYKPAFRRVIVWWGEQIERGLREGGWGCWRCSGPMALLPPLMPANANGGDKIRARFQCGRCDAEFSLPVSGLAFHSAVGQRFWQNHPRMRVAPERTVSHSGRRAVVARYEDMTGAASLEILYAADTFQPLRIWGDIPPETACNLEG